jgi:uncharacterized membrane protein YfcA
MLFVPLGIVAGMVTTVAGFGGGILLQVVLSLALGPRVALAVSAPALLIGNLHRAVHFRAQIDRGVARSFVLGALPGSLIGGLTAVVMPPAAMQALMLAMASLAVARPAELRRWKPSAALMIPASAGIGMVSATSGGAGLLVSPLLLSAGLTGERYVSTAAVAAVSMHAGRLVAYGVGGLVSAQTLEYGAALTAAILVGNVLGAHARKHLSASVTPRVELGVLWAATALAVAGVAR